MFSVNQQKAIELGESGEKALREQNEYDALQYIEYLRELGEELLNIELPDSNFEADLKRVAISLRNIGNKAVQKRIESVASNAVDVIGTLVEPSIEKDFSNALWSFSKAVQEIGKGAAQAEMLETSGSAVKTLEMIGKGAVAKKMEVVTLWTTMSLEEIGYLADKKQLQDLSNAAKTAREGIIKASEDNGFVTREQVVMYPKLISQTLSEFSDMQNLQPAGYEDNRPNEEFTEEEFFEEEAEEEPETGTSEKEK
ncbi:MULTISPECIES: hypothetical protein [unclassified Methanosarcina]|uniref:hypothetical protein n=1 Tax=unclassified Methanosarcina TaxID=2644672 RepID=UPI000615789F|nr:MULTISPECIES: hypothetical protein [unclassified Methanosarcina]AKB18743.1 hypothetical protein MSWHS_1880 [Methanosarcina sp. WWM596]AKB21722.1 hypothetical protein MSWH1_1451 [Methanosarcina sp. WH1]